MSFTHDLVFFSTHIRNVSCWRCSHMNHGVHLQYSLAGILSVQLIATTLTCALFMLSTGLQTFLIANPWALLVSFGVSFGTLIAMMCNPTLARSYPHNYTLLALFTLAEAVSVGFVCMVRPSHLSVQCHSLHAHSMHVDVLHIAV